MLLKIGLYFLLLVFNYFLTKWLLRNRKLWLRIVISFGIGIVLTGLVLFELNDATYIDQGQVTLLKSKQHTNADYIQEGYSFIKDRFIIVDNSYDKQLIERPDIAGDSCNTAITDRKKLTEFFRFANRNIDHIDLVICDIGLDEETTADTTLKQEMDKIYFSKKLLVSFDEESTPDNIFTFDSLIQGNIREAANESRFISHTIKPGKHQSLAYKIYAFENNIQISNTFFWDRILQEKHPGKHTCYSLNNFIPSFSLTEESILIGEEAEDPTIAYTESEKVTSGYNWITLGTTATQEGQKDLRINLENRKERGLKNYLLLGTFKNPDEDIHHTIYKPLHGVTILLNIFYDLHKGINRINIWKILFLLVGFSFISFILISLSLGYPVHELKAYIEKKKGVKKSRSRAKKDISKFTFISVPLKFIFLKKLHYVLLLMLFISVSRYSGLVFNILFFTIYFLFFEISMTYYVKQIELKTQNHEK